jgi:hypothetical protein
MKLQDFLTRGSYIIIYNKYQINNLEPMHQFIFI